MATRRSKARKRVQAPTLDPPGAVAGAAGTAAGAAVETLRRVFEKLFRKWDAFIDFSWWWGWHQATGLKMGRNLFSRFITAPKHQIHGMTSEGFVNLWLKMLDAVMYWSIHTEPEIMDEFLGEMIQEALSYAVQTSMGGTMQTIMNVYRGGSPYPPDNTSQIGRMITALDTRLAAFLTASAGYNAPTAAADLLYGALQDMDDKTAQLRPQIVRMVEDASDTALVYVRVAYSLARSLLIDAYQLVRELRERYAHLREQVARTHLARANEYLDSLQALKRWYEAGLIAPEEFERAVLATKLEIEASLTAYDEAIQALDEAYDEAVVEADAMVTEAFAVVDEAVKLALDAFNAYFRAADRLSRSITAQYRDALWEALDGVASYRNVAAPVFFRPAVTPERPPVPERLTSTLAPAVKTARLAVTQGLSLLTAVRAYAPEQVGVRADLRPVVRVEVS